MIDSFYNDHRSVLIVKHQSFRDEIADQLVDIIIGNTEFTARERFKVERFLVVIDKLTAMSFRMDEYMPKCVVCLAFCRDWTKSAMMNYGDHLKR